MRVAWCGHSAHNLVSSTDCFYRLNNLPFALADYQQALELSPTDWGLQCRVAVVLCELGVQEFGRDQFSRAEELFSSAISYNPKVSRFYVCRARARYEGKVGVSPSLAS